MARAHSPSRRRAGDFGREPHNHQHCIDDALDRAAALCEQRGSRLTDIRRRVLELVWRNHAPVGAYDLLDEIRKDGRIAAPPTVYRALDFLREQGLVHRLESLNAFVGCARPDRDHVSQFLICTGCQSVAELDAPEVGSAVSQSAAKAGFVVDRMTIEMHGLCPACSRGSPASRPRHA
ncbi:MAG TPA: Fur family transcriptional regulator [Dongiaceae bacterium]|jgi:Fur family zinc uptake transcriptional regulator